MAIPGLSIGARLAGRGRVEVAAQGELGIVPGGVPEPGPRVVGALGGEAQQIVDRALHPPRGREEPREIGIRRAGFGHVQVEHR